MLYFRKNDETIEKYQVSFDKEEIEKIKKKIINNCSKKTHVIRESTLSSSELINNPLGEKMSHLKKKNTGRTTSYSDTSEDKTVYEYDYILITYPYLTFLVDKLLSGDETAIYDMVDYKIEYPINYDELLTQERGEINRLVDNNPEEVIKKAENLKKLLEEKELNKNQQGTGVYYNQLVGLIKFNLIDSLPISELDRIESFLNINLSREVEISNHKERQFVKSLKKTD